jgi:hypothetical protein
MHFEQESFCWRRYGVIKPARSQKTRDYREKLKFKICGNRRFGCSHGEFLTKEQATELVKLLVVGGGAGNRKN